MVENQASISLIKDKEKKEFNYDYVADEKVPQHVIFENVARPIAESCLQGYNGTIFAYGQTGSGKTFTIQGPQVVGHNEGGTSYEIVSQLNSNEKMYALRGLMQRSFEYIFQHIEDEKAEAL